jgi:hypothetical protein
MKLAFHVAVAVLASAVNAGSARAARPSAAFSVSVVLSDACSIDVQPARGQVAVVRAACNSGTAMAITADGEPHAGGSGLLRVSRAIVPRGSRRDGAGVEVITLTF